MPSQLVATITLLVLALAAGLALANVAPAPAGGATFVVTKTDDTADGACNADCSLREAIIAANAAPGADVVQLGAETYVLGLADDFPVPDEEVGDLDITDGLSLNGLGANSTTIDANGIARVMEISEFGGPATIQINNLTITGGVTDNSGGGIAIDLEEEESTVTIRDTVIRENIAGSGGGIYANNEEDGGNVEISDSVISDNTANSFAAGLVNFLDGGTLSLNRSTVSGNHSMGYNGGVQHDGDGVMDIVDSTISENRADLYAGGVYNNQEGTLNITRSLVTDNHAVQYGGGVMNNTSGSINILNSTISVNEAGDDGGGGIYQNGSGPISIASSTITQNAADAGTGGGIHLNDEGPITLLSTIVADNSSSDCFFEDGTELADTSFSLDSDDSCDLSPGDNNKSGQDPQLEPLADNGGPTLTHALDTGSPAIDAGSDDDCPPTDQRGFARPAGDSCDIGAFEAGAEGSTPTPSPTASPGSTATPPAGQVVWGDHNCSGSPDPIDGLFNLRHDAGLPTDTGGCRDMGTDVTVDGAGSYPWGDLDCSGAANPVDGLKILRFDAGLSVDRPEECPDPGETVTIVG